MQSSRVIATALVLGSLAAFGAACGKKGPAGIPECDAYFKQADTCADDSIKSEATSNKEAWKNLAQDKVKEQCVARGNYAKDRCDIGPEGVADCDEYFKVMKTCTNATQKGNETNNRDAWKTRPKSTLGGACKTALDTAKTFCK